MVDCRGNGSGRVGNNAFANRATLNETVEHIGAVASDLSQTHCSTITDGLDSFWVIFNLQRADGKHLCMLNSKLIR
jgi:hypothetical protein